MDRQRSKKWLKPVLFLGGGALAGLAYYFLVGCATGTCAITSNPISSMLYGGIFGWLLSGLFSGAKDDGAKDGDCGH